MIAVIGLGDWGSKHLATLGSLVGPAEVVGVDDCPDRRSAAEQLGFRTVAAVDQLPEDISSAVVATPTPTHAAIAAPLLEQGVALLVEKPLAADCQEAGQLVRLAELRGVPLMVGHVFLFQRAYARLRETLAGLGPLRTLSIERRTPGLVKRESGAWLELAPHEIATALDLGALADRVDVEPLRRWSVTGVGREDGASGRFTTDSTTVEISCSWLSAVRSRRVWAIAESGQALLVDDGREQWLAVWSGQSTWTRREPIEPTWEDVSGPPPLRTEWESFLAAMHEGGPIRSDGRLGLRVVELLTKGEST
ncbi:Gfo/Idh/MocA family protein [Tenggerimyces flavus]|uniref:Gfo/Idh/MocA family protein n=1 Tax=Tenggerimyces flavus TaxID=1708749 RepID=A0ABV7YKC4_9ACTN|nr:Gfo/Idh/MocA family oxidoreductase [Tenggerimyces flavus]MBM7789576.1 putative dehydrogenase [Tenggerimyces flavus]